MLKGAPLQRLTPTHANKQGKRYRYYVSRRLITEAGTQQKGWRLPAQDLEEKVLGVLTSTLSNPIPLLDRLEIREADQIERALGRAPRLEQELTKASAERKIKMLKELVTRITLAEGELTIELQRDDLHQKLGLPVPESTAEPVELSAPLQRRRRGVETRLILPASGEASRKVDPTLVKALIRGHSWFQQIASGAVDSLTTLGQREGVTRRYVSRMVQLTFLAPDIVEAILEGTQPPTLTLQQLTTIELPLDWHAQRAALGF